MDNSPGRMLQREFRRAKLLKRYDSLPSVKLLPKGRPLYSCQRCRFTNIFGEICPWCASTCVNVAKGPVRSRRISAPHLLNDLQKEQLLRIEKKQRNAKPILCGKPIPLGYRGQYEEGQRPTRQRRHRLAAVYSVEDITAAANLNVESAFYVRSIMVGAGKPESVELPTVSETSSDTLHVTEDEAVKKIQVAIPVTPPRTLRRRRRFSILKKRSSCSLRSRSASQDHRRPQSDQTVMSVSSSSSQKHLPSQAVIIPPSWATIRIGHPARPLYTAIRKGMSSPAASPPGSPTRTTFASTPLDSSARRARSAEMDRSSVLPTDLLPRLNAPMLADPSLGIGCSVSGETELRIALARRSTITGSGYRYQERKEPGESVKVKVKKLGQGLRDLVLMRRG